MAALLFMMIFLVIIYTSQCQTCIPPTDLKAFVVNNYKDLQLTWNKPKRGPEVLDFVIYINGLSIRTKETTYLIQNPQYQVYKIIIDSNCGQFGHSSRFSVNIGFVGKAVYSIVGQSSVDIDWSTTATLNDTVDIKNKDQNINIFILQRSNKPVIFETRFKNRITYNGNLRSNKISFTLSTVTSLDAGFYISAVGTIDKGGRVLVVLDRPRKPTIPNRNSYVGKSLELTCNSQKTSKPDYYTPELNYTWFLNGSIHVYKQSLQGRYSQIQNKLIIDNVTRQDKGHRFSCKASDRGQQSEQSDTINLDPLYGPEIIILAPDKIDNVVKVGEKFGPINCSAQCNPYCIFTWKFRNPGDTGQRIEITRSNILTIDKVTREDAGEYRCAVRSSDSNTLPQTNSKTIDLNVKFQPEIKNITYLLNGGAKLVINNGQVFTVSENDDINLQCNIEANPKASISWKRDCEVLKHNSSGESLIYNLGQSISCENSGIYSCVADNGIMSAVQRNVSLRVQCKPKQSTHSSVSNRYGSRLNSTVNVSLFIFAYPRPQHRWTSNTTGTIIERPTSVINSYSFKYEGLVNIRRATDFGSYCLELTNDKGSSRVCLQIQKEANPTTTKSLSSTHFYVIIVVLLIVVVALVGAVAFLLMSRKRPVRASTSRIDTDTVSRENTKLKTTHTATSRVKTDRVIKKNTKEQKPQVIIMDLLDVDNVHNAEDGMYSEITENCRNETSDARIPKRQDQDCQETGCDTMMDEDGYLAATDLGENQTNKLKQTDPKHEVHCYMTLNVQNRDVYDTTDV